MGESSRRSRTNKKIDLLWIGVAKRDGVLPRAKQLAEPLPAHGIEYDYHETDGGHTYPVCRKLLVDNRNTPPI